MAVHQVAVGLPAARANWGERLSRPSIHLSKIDRRLSTGFAVPSCAD
jgi:hypothetical protein